MAIYKARKDSYTIKTNIEAQIVGVELERLFPEGYVDKEALLKSAQKRNSPLHQYFEWDDAKAANNYRLDQARHLLRSIVVIIDNKEIPYYHNVKIEDDGNKYVDVFQCKESPDLWSQVLASALSEAEVWARRYENYQELEPIRAAIRQTKEKVK